MTAKRVKYDDLVPGDMYRPLESNTIRLVKKVRSTIDECGQVWLSNAIVLDTSDNLVPFEGCSTVLKGKVDDVIYLGHVPSLSGFLKWLEDGNDGVWNSKQAETARRTLAKNMSMEDFMALRSQADSLAKVVVDTGDGKLVAECHNSRKPTVKDGVKGLELARSMSMGVGIPSKD